MTDEMRLHQILRNLLSNAFKFTSEGEVALTISKMSLAHPELKDQETDVIAFSVSDTGIGIAENKLLQIFDAFKQADGATARKYGGTGLGLSISQSLANLLGGQSRLQVVKDMAVCSRCSYHCEEMNLRL